FTQFTAADRVTGYTRIDTSRIQIIYDVIFSNGTSTYVIDTSGYGSASEHQTGVSAVGAGDQVVNDDLATRTFQSHLDGTTASGAINVTYTNSTDGKDQYTHSVGWVSNLPTSGSQPSTSTETDKLTGSDTWHRDNAG